MRKEEIPMTATEMARLSDWLKAKGITAEETIDCLHYIACSVEPPDKKKSGSPSTTHTEEPEN